MHEADALALVPGAEPVAVALAASEGELLARLAPLVVEPLVEAPNAGTDVLLHVANVLNKKVSTFVQLFASKQTSLKVIGQLFLKISATHGLFFVYIWSFSTNNKKFTTN